MRCCNGKSAQWGALFWPKPLIPFHKVWLRGQDLNLRPSGYEPDELPGCSTPRRFCIGLMRYSLDLVLRWASVARVVCGRIVFERYVVFLVRSGGDLLSHVLRRSTIGATALNFRVRDGIGCFARAMATRPEKKHRRLLGRRHQPFGLFSRSAFDLWRPCLASTGSNQAYRAISTGQLNALLCLHLRPIDVVVFHGSQGIPCFEGGFPLRCLQRLSCPFIATQHCRWHDNWSTSGTFTPVLSY